jgi:hypothetical protein
MHHILTRPRKHQHFGTASELPPHRLKFVSVSRRPMPCAWTRVRFTRTRTRTHALQRGSMVARRLSTRASLLPLIVTALCVKYGVCDPLTIGMVPMQFSAALPIFLVFVREVVPTVNSVLWKPKTPSQFSLCVDATQPCEASHPICTPVLMPRRYCALTLLTIGLITRGRRSSDDPEDYTPNVQDG